MGVRLITLSENTAAISRGRAEWGLSILVQVDGQNILFDTGASPILLYNAKLMGVDLKAVDQIVISHGHYDHTGGLAALLEQIGSRRVIAHPAIWEARYARRSHKDEPDSIGIPATCEELEAKGAVFEYSGEPYEVADGVITTGEVKLVTPYEAIEPNLLVKRDGQLVPDTFDDDLSLIIKSPKGLIVILGCAHRGLINHLHHAQRITGEKRIYAIVGGTHLVSASEERMKATIEELKRLDVQRIGVSHCTGFGASLRFAQVFGDRFFLNNAGTIVDF